MMIERGDVAVLHEPLLALTEEGAVAIPAPGGGTVRAGSEAELLAGLAGLSHQRPVFVKEVLDYRYSYLIEHPREIAWLAHSFLVRDPRQAISSHYAIKPHVTCAEIGYERLCELFELAWQVTGRTPLVVRAEDLLRDPARVVRAYCDAFGLPFLPGALTWRPADRPEWRRTRAWHTDASHSSGFHGAAKTYPATVDNNARLKSFYDYHYPFYERIAQHAI
jgi:sulfotransferase family protein